MFENLGPALTLLREIRGRSQAHVARAAGIGKSQLSKYENSKELPKLDSLERVLVALGIGQLDLFSTLEMVNRRAGSLTGKPENPLAWLHAAELRSDLLPKTVNEAFNQAMTDFLALHRAVLVEAVRRGEKKNEEKE